MFSIAHLINCIVTSKWSNREEDEYEHVIPQRQQQRCCFSSDIHLINIHKPFTMGFKQRLTKLRNRRPGHFLPFRIPFFRIFYSTTYTALYILTLAMLVITPGSMIWSAIQNAAYQYIIMIGGTYILTAIIAIFVYASRLYTNRSVMVGVGKVYIPIEDGEVGKNVRKMIVNQLVRSAMIAWESRPRDLYGEILMAEEKGVLPPETRSVDRNDYTVGKEITIDPSLPPWGDVKHRGWSAPGQGQEEEISDLQFANVIAELPNLIEAQAVSLAPPAKFALLGPGGVPMADPVVADVLRRPATMGMREYLTQLSYLQLINPPEAGQSFLMQYERARFGALPSTEAEFKALMTSFAEVLSGMGELQLEIVERIREQAGQDKESSMDTEDISPDMLRGHHLSIQEPRSPVSSLISPVTARTAPSRSITPYLQHQDNMPQSQESLGSVLHRPDDAQYNPMDREQNQQVETSSVVGRSNDGDDAESFSRSRAYLQDTESLNSMTSETGSVVRHTGSSNE
jgi:hypothetical protein